VLTVGDRCVFHDNRIDLARFVTVGDDVGFSPEVVVYTHGYWGSVLEGFPCRFEGVRVGDGTLVGFRSTVLPGARVGRRCVVGAGSVVPSAVYRAGCVYAGNPAMLIKECRAPGLPERVKMLDRVVEEYVAAAKYRGLHGVVRWDYPDVKCGGAVIDVDRLTLSGAEDETTDDLRWHLFTRGIRVYTRRPFRKLEKR
jgi:hypothetical protein